MTWNGKLFPSFGLDVVIFRQDNDTVKTKRMTDNKLENAVSLFSLNED